MVLGAIDKLEFKRCRIQEPHSNNDQAAAPTTSQLQKEVVYRSQQDTVTSGSAQLMT